MCTIFVYLIIGISIVLESNAVHLVSVPAATPGVMVTIIRDGKGDMRNVSTQYQRLYRISGDRSSQIRSATHPAVEAEQKRIANAVAVHVKQMNCYMKQLNDCGQSCNEQCAEHVVIRRELLPRTYLIASDLIIKPLLAHWFFVMKFQRSKKQRCLPYVALHVCNDLLTPAQATFQQVFGRGDTYTYFYPVIYLNTPSATYDAIPLTTSFYAEMLYALSHELSHCVSYDMFDEPSLSCMRFCVEHEADRRSMLFMRSGARLGGPLSFFSRRYIYEKLSDECDRISQQRSSHTERPLLEKLKYQYALYRRSWQKKSRTHPCSLSRMKKYLVRLVDGEYTELFDRQEISDEVRDLRARSVKRWAHDLVTQTVHEMSGVADTLSQQHGLNGKKIVDGACKDITMVIQESMHGSAPAPDLYKSTSSLYKDKVAVAPNSEWTFDVMSAVGKLCMLVRND